MQQPGQTAPIAKASRVNALHATCEQARLTGFAVCSCPDVVDDQLLQCLYVHKQKMLHDAGDCSISLLPGRSQLCTAAVSVSTDLHSTGDGCSGWNARSVANSCAKVAGQLVGRYASAAIGLAATGCSFARRCVAQQIIVMRHCVLQGASKTMQ